MTTTLQQAVIGAMVARGEGGGAVPEGELAPLRVAPYGGELLDPARRLGIVPAALVEVDQGTLARLGSTGHFDAAPKTDVICCVRNAVNEASRHHDGARLMQWVIETFRDAEVILDSQCYRATRVSWQRIAMSEDARLWAGRVNLAFSVID